MHRFAAACLVQLREPYTTLRSGVGLNELLGVAFTRSMHCDLVYLCQPLMADAAALFDMKRMIRLRYLDVRTGSPVALLHDNVMIECVRVAWKS